MATKYVITFSNCTERGIEKPEEIYNQSVIEYVTQTLANAARKHNFSLDNCTAYPVSEMYKGVSESSFRLEYIAAIPADYMKECALWIKDAYKQQSILMEIYKDGAYI